VLASFVHTAFVAKAEIQGWPALGRIFQTADTIFIDRGRKRDVVRVMELVGQEIDRGLGVLVFPEGTSGKGDEILPFKPSLLEFACSRDLPVHWATLHYRTPEGQLPASQAVCWWGNEGIVPHFKRLIVLPSFEAILRFGDEPVAHGNRKELAEALRSRMLEHFEPML
jgi:1-acyl-sn-glycerol-3-phosphate acyltransferase